MGAHSLSTTCFSGGQDLFAGLTEPRLGGNRGVRRRRRNAAILDYGASPPQASPSLLANGVWLPRQAGVCAAL